MRNDGILPAFACLKIVTFATVNILASSSAVNARPIRSIRSGSDIGSADLFCELHSSIDLLCGFTSAATAAYCCQLCCMQRVCGRAMLSLSAHGCITSDIWICSSLLLFPVCQSRNYFRLGSESWTSNHEYGRIRSVHIITLYLYLIVVKTYVEYVA